MRSKADAGTLRHLWLSPWTVWVGRRYLKSKKSSRFLSFITTLSMGGVAIGVTAIIVVMSVMDGFEGALKKRLLATDLHILVEPGPTVEGFESGFVPRKAFEDTEAAQLLEDDPRVLTYWPIVGTEAILRSGRNVAGVVINGVTPERLKRLEPQIIESVDPATLTAEHRKSIEALAGVYVGKELAYTLALIPGDLVTMISPTETEGPFGSVPRLKRFYVAGVYESGQPDQELQTVFTSAQAVYSFLRRRDVASSWQVTMNTAEEAGEVGARLERLLPGYRVRDWMELNSNLFASLKLERVAMFLILTFIIIVASFNIVTTLTLMVLEKKREISILKAMGARHGQVGAIFLAEGLLIGGVGTTIGVLASLAICLVLKNYEIIQLPDVYYDRTLPVNMVPGYFIGVAVCAMVIVLLACLYPTRRAVRLHPLNGIRS